MCDVLGTLLTDQSNCLLAGAIPSSRRHPDDDFQEDAPGRRHTTPTQGRGGGRPATSGSGSQDEGPSDVAVSLAKAAFSRGDDSSDGEHSTAAKPRGSAKKGKKEAKTGLSTGESRKRNRASPNKGLFTVCLSLRAVFFFYVVEKYLFKYFKNIFLKYLNKYFFQTGRDYYNYMPKLNC